MNRPRGVLAALTTSALLLGCVACTGGPDRPTAREAAADLATALGTGTMTGLAFTGSTTPASAHEAWTAAVGDLGDSRAKVQVVSVDDSGDGSGDGPATARLRYVWALAGTGEPWTYETTARLTRDDQARPGWRVAWSPALVHPRLRTGDRLDVRTTLPERADVLGAGGAELVTARPVYRFGIDKAQVPAARAAASARALARRLDVDPAAYAERVRAAGAKAFVEAIVLRPRDARPLLAAGVDRIKGVGVLSDTLPLAPTREFARPVLGTVGPVTAEIVKESDGLYQAGDEAGLSGLEQRYDERLRGTPGAVVSVDRASGAQSKLFSVAAKPGEPLRTTLVPRLQTVAEQALADVAPASALVAVRPSTGDLLAVASGPGSGGLSTATVGRYAPGSTFKVVSSLALLRAGDTPATRGDCSPTTVVDGKSFKNYSDYPASALGRITLATAVANSCNTFFVDARDTVSQAGLASAAHALGLGVDHDLGFPAFFGSVPATDAEAGSATGRAASLIGQGKVIASPMAMAAVAASVAHGGVVVPRLLTDAPDDPVTVEDPVTPAEARRLRSLMRGVVTRGSGSFLAGLPGAPVAAKTGTAEFGEDTPPQTHAWMIALKGDLAVAVFVDVGASGSRTAGPVLEQFLRAAR